MTREEFLESVRGMLGTPFHHQGRLPGVGLDCGGVIVCALQAGKYPVIDFHGYGRLPHAGRFEAVIAANCLVISLNEVLPGDLMTFAWRTETQHIAVISSVNPVHIIHAYQPAGKVVENRLDEKWMERLRGCHRLKGFESTEGDVQ